MPMLKCWSQPTTRFQKSGLRTTKKINMTRMTTNLSPYYLPSRSMLCLWPLALNKRQLQIYKAARPSAWATFQSAVTHIHSQP